MAGPIISKLEWPRILAHGADAAQAREMQPVSVALSIAAAAAADFAVGARISLGPLYLIPLCYTALTQRRVVTVGVFFACLVLRELLGPIEQSSNPWLFFLRDLAIAAGFVGRATRRRLNGDRHPPPASARIARRNRDGLHRDGFVPRLVVLRGTWYAWALEADGRGEISPLPQIRIATLHLPRSAPSRPRRLPVPTMERWRRLDGRILPRAGRRQSRLSGDAEVSTSSRCLSPSGYSLPVSAGRRCRWAAGVQRVREVAAWRQALALGRLCCPPMPSADGGGWHVHLRASESSVRARLGREPRLEGPMQRVGSGQ